MDVWSGGRVSAGQCGCGIPRGKTSQPTTQHSLRCVLNVVLLRLFPRKIAVHISRLVQTSFGGSSPAAHGLMRGHCTRVQCLCKMCNSMALPSPTPRVKPAAWFGRSTWKRQDATSGHLVNKTTSSCQRLEPFFLLLCKVSSALPGALG